MVELRCVVERGRLEFWKKGFPEWPGKLGVTLVCLL